MSTLKKWLQTNQVFDKDLLTLFPKYGINDPENELKKLTSDQWKEIQTTITTDRAKELKDNAGKLRLQKKLTKIEKLWKQKRPKKKKKAPKLLKLFPDDITTTDNTSLSPTKSKKKGSKSPKKKGSKSPKKRSKTPTKDKKNKDTEPLNDKKTEETAPSLSNQLSVEEERELADVLEQIEPEQKDTGNEVNKVETEEKALDIKEEWDCYDDLRISDEEDGKETNSPGPSLFVPLNPLKHQGSVVDMLMDGPYNRRKEKKKIIPQGVMVTPPDKPTQPTKDYKVTVSSGDDIKDKEEDDMVNKSEDDKVGMNGIKTDERNVEKVFVSLNADRFVYNEAKKTYYISLSGCRLMKSDFAEGTIGFEIKGDLVNVDKSGKVEHSMDDKYIDKVLDEIHKNNPDTD